MIPKTIHYCWFGGNPKSELIERCIRSWKKYCPDYEIIEWNESNFDINCCDYVKEAYDAKKWAFVSDYARIWVLNKFGGVYLDTDVEITKNIDSFLYDCAFTGFESPELPFTAIFGSEPNHPFTNAILQSYKNRHFLLDKNKYDMTTNTVTVTKLLVDRYSIMLNNTKQRFSDGLVIYPSEYFCPVDYLSNKIRKTKNTHTIHWYNASWHTEEQDKEHIEQLKQMKKYNRITKTHFILHIPNMLAKKILGEQNYSKLKDKLKK